MAALAARRMPQQGGRTMAGRMHQQRVCVAADARRAKVMTVAMHSCNCFTTTEIKRMLDFIKQGLTVSLFWHHWSARTNGCTAHKDPGCQGGVFGITTSGVRYYWSGVRCQLSVCLLVSFVVRKSRRTRPQRHRRPQGRQVLASGVAKTVDGRSPSTVTPSIDNANQH